MVHKIGSLSDLAKIPIPDSKSYELLYHYAKVLTSEYGQQRNVNEDDGGYILFCPPGTKTEDIKAYLDYTKHIVEVVDKYDSLIAATYILHNEFAITLIMSAKDAPIELIKEIN